MSSWFSNPRLRTYFVARGLRILPRLWVCLIVSAFIIAPIAVVIQGGSAARLLLSTAPIAYVLKNSAVALLQFGIGGTAAESHGRTNGTVLYGPSYGRCCATSLLLVSAS